MADDEGDCARYSSVPYHEHVRQWCQTRLAPAVGLPSPLPVSQRPAKGDHQVCYVTSRLASQQVKDVRPGTILPPTGHHQLAEWCTTLTKGFAERCVGRW